MADAWPAHSAVTVNSMKNVVRYSRAVAVQSRAEAISAAKEADQIALVRRGRLRWAVFTCPCGCGELVSVNLDPRVGRAWRIRLKGEAVSLSPSVWRTDGCRSHFILWSNTVWLFGDPGHHALLPDDLEDEMRAEWLKWRALK